MATHFVRVQAVRPLADYTAELTFTNGDVRVMDFTAYTQRGGVFAPLRDLTVFRQMYVDGGTIAWPTGADIDPDVLYWGLTPATLPA